MAPLVMTNLQIALESDPHKKGVGLYRVECPTCGGHTSYVWARSNQEALSAVAKIEGYEAFPYRVGVQMETPLSLDSGAWEGLHG